MPHLRLVNRELEQLLDAKVFTVDPDQMQTFVERPKEIIVQYHSSLEYAPTPLTCRLQKQCSTIKKLEQAFESTNHHLLHLGPWCVNRLWQHYVDKLAENRDLTLTSADVRLAQELIKESQIPRPACDQSHHSPKVLKLIQLLRVAAEGLGDEFCGIVFVQRRETAIALCLLLQEMEELKDLLRVQVLTGHNGGDERLVRMSIRDQAQIISRFRTKEYNLLIATSVAEEGLDIQPCNFVVRYEIESRSCTVVSNKWQQMKPD